MKYDLSYCLAVLTSLAVGVLILRQFLENRQIQLLKERSLPQRKAWPSVSVIVAACNEERWIERAITSVLAQDYPDFEVIVVNDRSTDQTPLILERALKGKPKARLLTIRELPAGWLGKNHALHQGSLMARGEYLLFTDADIVMDPSLITRAMDMALEQKIDHLAVAPELSRVSVPLQTLIGVFIVFFNIYARPAKAKDPKSPKHVGIGAFNLVRAEAYRTVGGHAAIALRPDDDLKLGKILKQKGFRQDLANGQGLVSVEWYHTVNELIHGLLKNTFAGLEYNLAFALACWAGIAVFFLWPFAAVFLTEGAARVWNGVAILELLILYASNTRLSGSPAWQALGFPWAASLFLYIMIRSTFLTLYRGGIVWRGTFYPLKELRKNRV